MGISSIFRAGKENQINKMNPSIKWILLLATLILNVILLFIYVSRISSGAPSGAHSRNSADAKGLYANTEEGRLRRRVRELERNKNTNPKRIKVPYSLARNILTEGPLNAQFKLNDKAARILSLSKDERRLTNAALEEYLKGLRQYQAENATTVFDDRGEQWIALPRLSEYAETAKANLRSEATSILRSARAEAFMDMLRSYAEFSPNAEVTHLQVSMSDGVETARVRTFIDGKLVAQSEESGGPDLSVKYKETLERFKK